jgi:7-keto-8-aminopelargonate synthetase-like enzyme
MANKTNPFFETADQIITDGVVKGILHLYTEDAALSGNQIMLKGKQVINFGSCSYMGLEFDERLKAAAKAAIDDYGTQFAESRAYVSIRHYAELEQLLARIFDAHCVVTPTTTLGHIAALPVLVGNKDAVIVDQQAHNSIQNAAQLLKARGTHVELLRHNRMDLLEERVRQLRSKHAAIWYMADGVYSMFGDTSPVDDIYALMEQYPELHYYVDDAHGISVYGRHGRGHVLNNRPFHSKMVLAASMAKGFASGGGALLFHDAELARKVRTCGGPLITSGPMQPAALGAAVASAKIHLSEEMNDMQQELRDNIRYTRLLLQKYGMPLVSNENAAVFFVAVSLPKMGYNMIKRMLNAGYYLNLGIFPAVPIKNTGIRFTITRLHTFGQIESMVSAMATAFAEALVEEGLTMGQIYKAFKMPVPTEVAIDKAVNSVIRQALELTVTHATSIADVDKNLWDSLFVGKGSFDWEGLRMLENAFKGHSLAENNWQFDYLIVKDMLGKPVAATFATTAIYKDDMLSPAEVSAEVELKRHQDPYYLTSKVLATGSLLTEGEHFYIDYSSPLWKDAVQLILDKLAELQDQHEATAIMLRDFHGIDPLMDSFLVDNGYFRIAMPETSVADITHLSGKTDGESLRTSLSPKNRQNFSQFIARHENKFDVSIRRCAESDQELATWYQLYLNVKNNNLALNTFTLPETVFTEMGKSSGWEMIVLHVKKAFDYEGIEKAVAVAFCYRSGDTYNWMLIGLDYTYNKNYSVYRQTLYQVMRRAMQLNCQKVHLGFSAGIEKKKVGAATYPVYAYLQTRDTYNAEALAAMQVHTAFTPQKNTP